MKKFKKGMIITVVLLVVLFSLAQVYTAYSTTNTEHRKYEVLRSDKNIEIRQYGSNIMASVKVSGTFKEMQGKGFRTLAGYIFGGNSKNTSIAMTTPVIVNMENQQGEMSFVMPADFSLSNEIKPNNNAIKFETTDKYKMAVIGFGGFADEAKLQAHKKKLTDWLVANKIKFDPKPSYFFYNPPYQWINRKNEVAFKIME